jgi:hypothetical protein
LDEAHDSGRIGVLEALEKEANALATKLNAGECTQHKGSSCIREEEGRPLRRSETDKGWVRRPYSAYDPERMCHECAACWHANMARVCLLDAIRRIQIARRP